MKKIIIHFLLLGLIFLLVEYIARCFGRDTNTFHPSLLLMFFVGGLCAILIGSLNQNKWINENINIFWQSIIGAIMILTIEFISGVILNLQLKLNIWSYLAMPFNLLGQICLPYAFIWFCLCPFGFWIDDAVRYYVYFKTVPPYSLLEIYKKFWNPFDKPFI